MSPFLPPYGNLRGSDTIPLLDNILASHDSSIVHIRSDTDAGRSTEFVSRYLHTHSSEPVEIYRFDFNSRDIRFNNITAMLRTWLCRLAFRGMESRIVPTRLMLEYMKSLQAWTAKDLVFHWCRMAMDQSNYRTVYVIGGLEQCDSSRKHFMIFLERFLSSTETRLRIIITTTKGFDADTREELHMTIPAEIYRELDVDIDNLFIQNQEQLPVQLAILFQQHPRYVNTELEHKIAGLLGSGGLDDDLKHLLIAWFACDHISLETVEHHVNSLTPPTPELVFESILSDIPAERRNWARELLFWVSQSVRALRTEEFWVVSHTMPTDSSHANIQSILR